MLLTEFDESRTAVIEPGMVFEPVPDFPETVVSIFSHQLFHTIREFLGGKVIAVTKDVDGEWPVYEVYYGGKCFAFYKARLGAPACVGCFEDVIAMGAKRIILLGNCGVLDGNIRDCGIIIPTKAIRDEGTSYHYAPAADYIDVNKKHVDTFIEVLEQFGYPYVRGRHLDHRRLLPGDPGEDRSQEADGRGMRGDGMRRHAGHVRLPGRGIFPVPLRRGQPGPHGLGPQKSFRRCEAGGQGKDRAAGL